MVCTYSCLQSLTKSSLSQEPVGIVVADWHLTITCVTDDGIQFCGTHRSRSSSFGARTTPERASWDLNLDKTFCTECTGCLSTSIKENRDVSRTSEGLPAIGHITCYLLHWQKATQCNNAEDFNLRAQCHENKNSTISSFAMNSESVARTIYVIKMM